MFNDFVQQLVFLFNYLSVSKILEFGKYESESK